MLAGLLFEKVGNRSTIIHSFVDTKLLFPRASEKCCDCYEIFFFFKFLIIEKLLGILPIISNEWNPNLYPVPLHHRSCGKEE
ncbi:Protein of unknown function [Gryllus bimaculatus]|nr:Protein of unknown function [Gryllus bimaculatus]